MGPTKRANELTKLTLTILDYALNSSPVGLTKQVVYYLDEYGLPTTQNLAVGQVAASIAIDEDSASLLNTSEADELRIEEIVESRLVSVNSRIDQLKEYYPELVVDGYSRQETKHFAKNVGMMLRLHATRANRLTGTMN